MWITGLICGILFNLKFSLHNSLILAILQLLHQAFNFSSDSANSEQVLYPAG
jgi:hypothetical protein